MTSPTHISSAKISPTASSNAASGWRWCICRILASRFYRHDPVGLGTVPFAEVPRALHAAGYHARPMLEIISRDPDRDIIASASKLALLGFTFADQIQ